VALSGTTAGDEKMCPATWRNVWQATELGCFAVYFHGLQLEQGILPSQLNFVGGACLRFIIAILNALLSS